LVQGADSYFVQFVRVFPHDIAAAHEKR
jgi:hypothetical protein